MKETAAHKIARLCVDAGVPLTTKEICQATGVTAHNARASMRKLGSMGAKVTKSDDGSLSISMAFIPDGLSYGRSSAIPVIGVNGACDEVKFNSYSDAEENGFIKRSIINAIHKGTKYAGYYWRHQGDVKWTRSEIAALYRGDVIESKTDDEAADMRARLGIKLPPSVMKRKQIQTDIMACRITIDCAAEKYKTTPDKILKIMGWQ